MITQNFYSIPLYPILFCPDLSDPLEVNYNLSALDMSLAVKTGNKVGCPGVSAFAIPR